MKIADQYKQDVSQRLSIELPASFWRELASTSKQTYEDVFQAVKNDPNLVDQQRLHKLYQERHYRMENAVIKLAEKHGLSTSTTILESNGYPFIYVATPSIGLTQTYVRNTQALPNPARFREKLSESVNIPRLDLGDEEKYILGDKEIYGLIAHNPVGTLFTEEHQKLGMIQISIPSADSKVWNAQIAIPEIIDCYKLEHDSGAVSRAMPKYKEPSKDVENKDEKRSS